MTPLLRASLVCCGLGTAIGGSVLARAVLCAAGATTVPKLAVAAAMLLGFGLGAALSARRAPGRPWRSAALAQIAAGAALAIAAAVPVTPGSTLGAVVLSALSAALAGCVGAALVATGRALPNAAGPLAWLTGGAAGGAPLYGLWLAVVLGQVGSLVAAAAIVGGTGLLLFERLRTRGEPASGRPAPPLPATPATAFAIGLAAMLAACLTAAELGQELGDGPYADTLVRTSVLLGIALGSTTAALFPRRFLDLKFVAACAAVALGVYLAFSFLGSSAFATLRWLPFYDFRVALLGGSVLALAAMGPALALGPVAARRPKEAAAGALVAVLLYGLLPAGASAIAESTDERFVGLVGGLLHRAPKTVLVIEEGRATSRALREFPEVRSLSRATPRQARRLCGGRRFDLVAIDGTDLMQAYVSALYSREFLACARDLLRPGGLVVQRLPLGGAAGPTVGIVLSTFARSFSDVQLWVAGTDLVLCGASDPIRIDAPRVRTWFAAPGRLQASVRDHWHVKQADELFGHYVMGRATLLRAIPPPEVLTDDRPWLELEAPFALGLRIPPAMDALWRVKMLGRDLLPTTSGAIVTPGVALAGAARGGFLRRDFATQTAEQGIALGGGAEAEAALRAVLTADADQLGYDARVSARQSGLVIDGQTAAELPIPARLHGRPGLAPDDAAAGPTR